MTPENRSKWHVVIGSNYVAGFGQTYEGIHKGQHISVTPGIVITQVENRAMTFTSRREAASLARKLGGEMKRTVLRQQERPQIKCTNANSIGRREKMQDLPDAPWIREAEMYGMPPYDDGPDPTCPVCGEECETIYTDKDGDPVGCDQCVTLWEAYEWCEKHREEKD